jgi:predicted nucleic acid-binding protein
MPSDVSFDTNVLVYMVSGDESRATRATDLVRNGGIVSVQVLNEYANVMRRKVKADWVKIATHLAAVQSVCVVVPVTLEVHDRGFWYAERYQLGIHDAMIVAASVLGNCTTLFSEDMHDGLVIDGLTVRNPFRGF